ncbi:hypothetical protein MBANPS3_009787, partial [Mucor bainieri]
MRVFYQDFEVLVTGGLYGNSSDSSGHGAFLGSSKVPFELMGNTCWIAHVPTEEATTVNEIRVLRNYMKQGSHHQLCFKSVHFANKNFETCRPLDLHFMHDLDNYYKLASFLISCAHNDTLTAPNNKDRMRQILNDARFWEDLAGASKNSTDADILIAARRLQENLDSKKKEGKKLGKWKLWLIVAVLAFNTDDINKELVNLYKDFLYQKCSQLGEKTGVVTCSPEPVSTDFDGRDGADSKLNVFGTSSRMIDAAGNRFQTSKKLDYTGVEQPAWKLLPSVHVAFVFTEQVGYPVFMRPYVLSGVAMNVVYTPNALKHNLTDAIKVSPLHPAVITKFIENAQEIQVDSVANKGNLIVHAVSGQVKNAGIHYSDVAKAFEMTGPVNTQDILNQAEPLLNVID